MSKDILHRRNEFEKLGGSMERQAYRPRLVKILKDNGIPERLLAASSFWKNNFYVTINDTLDPDTKQCLIWDLEKEFPGYKIEIQHF